MIFGVRLGQLGCSLLRWLGGDWGCSGDLVPGGEPVGHFAAVVLGAQPVAAGPEVRGDTAERGEEPLRLFR
jgi:hypothetical protein